MESEYEEQLAIESVEPVMLVESPPWSRSTKVIVTVASLLLLALIAYRFEVLLYQLITAAILAYLMNPFITMLDKRTSLNRVHAILIVYLGLAVLVIGGLVALGVAAFQQSQTLLQDVPAFIEGITTGIRDSITSLEPIAIGGFEFDPRTLDWGTIQNQLLGVVEPGLGRGGVIVGSVATATMRLLGNILFVFVLSIYFAAEIPRLGSHVRRVAAAPGYREDAERMMREFGHTWNAYLRGQVALALVIFAVVWIGLSLLGVENSLALGLLAGLLEFIPIIGPIISISIACLVAFFQPTTIFGLANWQYVLVVLGFMTLVQQLESNILLPRIVGDALDLNPILVIIAVFMGGSIAGILGMLLAAPVMASIKVIGSYAWRKMFDLPPFPKPEPGLGPSSATVLIQRSREIVTDLTKMEPPKK